MFLLVFVLYPNPFNDLFLVSPGSSPKASAKVRTFSEYARTGGNFFQTFLDAGEQPAGIQRNEDEKKMKDGSRRRKGLYIIYNTKPKEDMREKEKTDI